MYFNNKFRIACLSIAIVWSHADVNAVPAEGMSPAARRALVLQQADKGAAAVGDLCGFLNDDSLVVRRTAARLLSEMSAPDRDALEKCLRNDDFLVRRIGLLGMVRLSRSIALPALDTALGDDNIMVRQQAVVILAAFHPQTDAITALLERASQDKAPEVRIPAATAVWPFYKNVVSIRNRKDWDHDVVVAKTISLPIDNWKFKLDPSRDGHKKDWFTPGFDDSKWADIAIEQSWQSAGYDYTGVSWYRRIIELPKDLPKHIAVELCFKGVDECAWVWINGKYVGQHDVGPAGWNQAFTLDVTKELKWGAENQVTVRAMNTSNAGGIWQPILIEVLK